MLISLKAEPVYDAALLLITALLNEAEPTTVPLAQPGFYEINHFGNSAWPGPSTEWDRYPDFPEVEDKDGNPVYRGSYGVCDNPEQILEFYPELKDDPERKFVVSFKEVTKASQPAEGGWRWHKWGEYIGKHHIQYEYLYDEKDIESVLCYHIYEYKDKQQ